jgi:hypothetical protein
MVNPGKPAEVKRLVGSRHYQPGESVTFLPEVEVMPEPLRVLGPSGLELWKRIWSMGKVWLSLSTDIDVLQILCEQLDERDALRELVMSDAEAWRERAALRELEKSIRSNLSILGFTPTDRMKLGVAEVQKMSKLEELMAMKRPDAE